MEMNERDTLLQEIVERELAMFLSTPNEGGPSACQMRPDAFRAMRRMTHSIHNIPTLASYLADLKAAEACGRNFMIEKYARMDNRLPPLSSSPLLDEIADAETAFLEEAATRYPHVIKRNGEDFFRHYLRCELETLSPTTLELYAQAVRQAKAEGRNLAIERHRFLFAFLGKGSLEEAEAAARG